MSPPLFSVKREPKNSSAIEKDEQPTDLEAEGELPPVVARMVVEIRSDGSKTIARGALEDLENGERIALQARADNPIALARELTRSILQTPVLASSLAKQALLDKLPEAVRDSATGKFRLRPDKLPWRAKKEPKK